MLTRLTHALAALLEDKSSADARGVAIEHLGTVASMLRRAQLDLLSHKLPCVRIGKATSVFELSEIATSYVDVVQHLDRQRNGDVQGLESASVFWQAQALTDLKQLQEHLDQFSEQTSEEHKSKLQITAEESQKRMLKLTEPDAYYIAKGDEEQAAAQLSRAAQLLTLTSLTFASFNYIKNRLLHSVDEQAVGNRSKALRAIGAISTVDADLLEDDQVRSMVEARLADSSPGVRDTAVNLLGKYLLRKRARISQYFSQLLARLHDSSLAVRKRVLKLLTGFYDVLEDDNLRVELCVRVVRSVADEDSGLQQLALNAVGEMWFGLTSIQESDHSVLPSTTERATPVKKEQKSRSETGTPSVSGVSESETGLDDLACHASIIMKVCGQLRERPSPLEEVFRRIMRGQADEAAANILLRKFKGLVERLIDGLVVEESVSSAALIDTIKTIHTIVSTHPATLSLPRTKALLPYLKSSNTVSEHESFPHTMS